MDMNLKANRLMIKNYIEKYHHVIAFILYQVFAILFYFEVVLLRHKSFLNDWDGTAQTFPWFVKNFNSLKSGTVALWDFSTYSGTTFIGEMQTAPLYPFTAAFSLLYKGGFAVIDLWIVFHFGLAAFFMYLFLRYKNFSSIASFAGAVIFTFVGSVANRASAQANIFAGLVYLPMVLLLFEKGVNNQRVIYKNIWPVLCGMFIGMSILAGHMQPCIHIVICMVFYGVFLYLNDGKSKELTYRIAGVFMFTMLITVLFAGIQLFPTIEYLNNANRWYGEGFVRGSGVVPYSQYGFHSILTFADMKSFFIPSQAQEGGTLYFTQVGIVLLFFSFYSKRPIKWFSIFLVVFTILFAMGDKSVISYISYHIPVVNKVREPIRILFLYNFAVAIAVALGIDTLHRLYKKYDLNRHLWIITVGIIIILIVVDAHRFTTKLPGPVSHPRHPVHYYHESPIVKHLEKDLAENMHLYRMVALPNELLPPNIGNVYDVSSARGHRATMYSPYFDYLSKNWDLRSEVYDNLAVKYVVTKETFPEFNLVMHHNDMRLYERPTAQKIFSLKRTDNSTGGLEIKKVEWGVNSVRLEIDNAEEGMLIFSQPYYPGWRAIVEGRKTKPIKHEGLTAIKINRSTRNIKFYYYGTNFFLYVVLSCIPVIYLFALIGITVFDKYNRRHPLTVNSVK